MAAHRDISIFALGSSRAYADRVCRHLDVPLAEHEEREFEDGEHKARSLVDVRHHDAFVIHALHGEPGQSVNDKLCRLLFFAGALKDAGAHRVTAIAPYLSYARKDRRTKAHDPVTIRYLAQMAEAVGVDGVVTIDVHNLAAFENAFRCRTEHLEAIPLFVEHFAPLLRGKAAAIVSPDIGGAKRAEQFRRDLAATGWGRFRRDAGRRRGWPDRCHLRRPDQHGYDGPAGGPGLPRGRRQPGLRRGDARVVPREGRSGGARSGSRWGSRRRHRAGVPAARDGAHAADRARFEPARRRGDHCRPVGCVIGAATRGRPGLRPIE